MGRKNYTKYSETPKETKNIEENQNTVEVQTAGFMQVEGQVTETEVETTIASTFIEEEDGQIAIQMEVNNFQPGVVTAGKLNVRKEADKEADVLRVISYGTSVLVDLTQSTEDFYKIKFDDVEGYCMKEFILMNK